MVMYYHAFSFFIWIMMAVSYNLPDNRLLTVKKNCCTATKLHYYRQFYNSLYSNLLSIYNIYIYISQA